MVRELRTPLYRIHLFQNLSSQSIGVHPTPKIIEFDQQPTPLPPEVEAHVLWHGGQPSPPINSQSNNVPIVTDRLPILMYHRVAPTGKAEMNRWRVTPEAFDIQLKYLRDEGFYSVSWEEWWLASFSKQPLPGRAIMITFDDGYLDFLEYAYPLLKQHGFSATVFLVADRIGQTNDWDDAYGEKLSLMDWQQILQLQAEGIVFGSHSATHRPLTALSPTEVVREAARSRGIISRKLGVTVNTFAYPYGDYNPAVAHLIGACGYQFGISCRSGFSQLHDSMLTLPRIEVTGKDSLSNFIVKLISWVMSELK